MRIHAGLGAVAFAVGLLSTACEETPATSGYEGAPSIDAPSDAVTIDTAEPTDITEPAEIETSQAECVPGTSLGCVSTSEEQYCDQDRRPATRACARFEWCGVDRCVQPACEPLTRTCGGFGHTIVCADDGSGFLPDQQCTPGSFCHDGECVNSRCETFDRGFLAKLVEPSLTVGCVFPVAALPRAAMPGTEGSTIVTVSNLEANFDVWVRIQSGETGEDLPLDEAETTIPKRSTRSFSLPTPPVSAGSSEHPHSWFVTASLPVSVTVTREGPATGVSEGRELLFPGAGSDDDYVVVGWPSVFTAGSPGEPVAGVASHVTIIATRAGETTISLRPTAALRSSELAGGPPAVAAGELVTRTLTQGQVLTYAVAAETGTADLTGTVVSNADRVAVFFSHGCAAIPEPTGARCSPMSHQMPPRWAFGAHYAADVFARPTGATPETFRVVALEDGTDVTCAPAIDGCSQSGLKVGEVVQYVANQPHDIEATHRVAVGHYMAGSDEDDGAHCGGAGLGASAFTLLVAPEQWLREYLVETPPGASEHWASVVGLPEADVLLDGQAVDWSTAEPLPGGLAVARVALAPGTHYLEASNAFGLTLYGYGCGEGYAYSGGQRFN